MSLPITTNPRRRGRPPLNLKPTVVRLSKDTIKRIEALVGKRRMAEFIREAVERELKRQERKD
jgi:Arc/MetJ-type ribon-helix-helix transcriptional regulator